MSSHDAERVRDIPASCLCAWQWDIAQRRYVLITVRAGCPWHTDGRC